MKLTKIKNNIFKKKKFIYFFDLNLLIYFLEYYLKYIKTAKIVQTFKLFNNINFQKIINFNKKSIFFKLEN